MMVDRVILPEANAAPEAPDGPFFSKAIRRVATWLSQPSSAQDAHLARALAVTLLDHRATLVISGLSTLVAASAAWIITGAAWVLFWLLADLALSLVRVLAMEHARRHPEVDRVHYIPILMMAGLTWSVLTGIVGAICMAQSNPVVAILGTVVTAGYAGGISSRNAATPRYGLIIICLAILPLSLGTLLSPNPQMPLTGALIPLWAIGAIGIMRHNHNILVRMMRAEEAMRVQARTDSLTGLANRSFVDARLQELCDQLGEGGDAAEFAVLLIDLDGFKQTNDSHGHHAGDQLLKEVARRIAGCVRHTDHVCRLGGDEFVVILNGPRAFYPDVVAQRIIDVVSMPVRSNDFVLQVGASIGGAIVPRDGRSPDAILTAADNALYAAKARGKGVYCDYGDQPAPATPASAPVIPFQHRAL